MKTIFIALVLLSVQAFADYNNGACFNPVTTFPVRMRVTPLLQHGVSIAVVDAESKQHVFLLLKPRQKFSPAQSLAPQAVYNPQLRYVGIQKFKDNLGKEESLPTYQECD